MKSENNENISGLGKIIGITLVFLLLGLISSFVIGFVKEVTFPIPKKSLSLYKVLSSIEYFFAFLPPVLITGYVVSCAVYFGHNSGGSFDRFSKAMFGRYKSVMITAIVCSALLTFGNEIFLVGIKNQKNSIENRFKIVNEYLSVGQSLFDNGFYERSMYYADAVLSLDPENKSALKLKDDADVEINKINNADYRFKLYETVNDELNTVDKVEISQKQLYDVYQCLLKAQTAYENQKWFDAHYYAQMGLNLASPKDPNLTTLQSISTSSWNNLSELHKVTKTEEQKIFARKYEGYLALVENDDLNAYYIFRELYQTSRELQHDPDVTFYLEVAEARLKERYFFVDETIELNSFEKSNDIFFSIPYKDGSKDIVYFKGLRDVARTGRAIQYVRDLTVVTIESDGQVSRKMTVPYAKILPVDIKSMNSTTKMLMGIDDSINSLPYIMLNSVGRDKPNTQIKPVYTYYNEDEGPNPEYLLLPISYDDFLLVESSSINPDSVPFTTLLKLVNKAKTYGFSAEVYKQVLMDRIFYPLFIMTLFIFLAILSWHNRIGNEQLFKMSWVLSFPFLYFIAYCSYGILKYVFQLLNYTLLVSNQNFALVMLISSGVYIFIFIIFSLRFLSLRARL
ncbi:MAG: hypothetical protein K5866_11165 [Treponema sp.]|nr:hypothetical protein [Treponema sp.]